RRGNPLEEIPPSNDVYEFIQFRAADVISVQFESEPALPNDPAIVEPASHPQQQPQPQPQQNQPAAVHQQQASKQYYYGDEPSEKAPLVQAESADVSPGASTNAAAQQDAVEEAVTDTESVTDANERQQGGYQNRRQGGYSNNNGGHARGGYSNRGGRGGYNNQNNRRGGHQGRGGYQPRGSRRVEIPESDFDFESSNSKLNKDDLAKEFAKLNVHVSGDGSSPSAAAGASDNKAATATATAAAAAASSSAGAASAASESYTPNKSFFDDISCEAKERMLMQERGLSYEERRSRIQAERQQNFETFGQTASEQSRFRYSRYNSGGRGGAGSGGNWRGGRGGRGGYYRGGNNNNNNNGGYRGGYNQGYRNQYNNSSNNGSNAQQQNAESAA
ncbi:hypothetical protein LPJ75_001656, partial [Coemansia sp. RSA 2598]